jgi:predicted dehydrogenase
VKHVFGLPKAVRSAGVVAAASNTGVDSLTTEYVVPGAAEVVATGHWLAAPGFGFSHGFQVCLERATVEFDLKSKVPLTVHPLAGPSVQPKLPKDDGYLGELRHFVKCIAAGKASAVVTPEDARDAVKVTLAEVKSVKTGKTVVIR